MTHRESPREVRRESHRAPRLALLASSLVACAALVGCGEEEAPVVVAPPPPPPKPVVEAPKVVSVAELMTQYDIDPRVSLPEERAPRTTEQRVAVLKFFDAFARGNADALKPMMSAPDQFELDRIVANGQFKASTEPITRIDVRCGPGGGDECALAVFHVGDEFQPQLWSYVVRGEAGEFDAIATPPGVMEKLSGDEWISTWHAIVRAELAKADEPDQVLEIPQQNFTKEEEAPAGGTPGVETPSAPGGAPGKRPPGPPIQPPKAPGFGTK